MDVGLDMDSGDLDRVSDLRPVLSDLILIKHFYNFYMDGFIMYLNVSPFWLNNKRLMGKHISTHQHGVDKQKRCSPKVELKLGIKLLFRG